MSQHRHYVVRASVLRGFETFAEERGFRAYPLLEQAGLPVPLNTDHELELSFDRVARLMELCAASTGITNFGLEYAKVYPIGGMGLFAFLFLNSGTIEDAMRTVVRFFPLLRIPFRFTFEVKLSSER